MYKIFRSYVLINERLLNSKLIYFLKRTFNKIFSPITYLFALIFLIIVRILSPFFLIRWFCLLSSRVGHYLINTELYNCLKNEKLFLPKKKYLDIFYNRPKVCNPQIHKMWKREIFFLPSFFMHAVDHLNDIFNKFINANYKHDINEPNYIRDNKHNLNLKGFINNNLPPHNHFDRHYLLNNTTSSIKFTKFEIEMGNNFLKELGINDSKIVSLFLRDDEYLKKTYPKNNWDYSDYRNVRIENFEKSIDWLIKNNYFVVKINKDSNQKIKDREGYIDLSNHPLRNYFLEVFLPFKSEFGITTNTGIDSVCEIFRKPMLCLNLCPILDNRVFNPKFMFNYKKYYSDIEKKYLSLDEIFKYEIHSINNGFILDKKKIKLEEQSSEEVLNDVITFVELVNNNFLIQKQDLEFQEKFRSKLLFNLKQIHKCDLIPNKIQSILSLNFIKNNPNWF